MAIIRLRAPKPNMMPVTPYRTVLPDTKLTMKALYRRHKVDLSSSKDDFASSIPRDILTVADSRKQRKRTEERREGERKTGRERGER